MELLGIDIGGSGIKGALVDTTTGIMKADRFRLPTPEDARPGAVADTVKGVVKHFDYSGPIGCGFPAVVRDGEICSAANISQDWIGVNAQKLFSKTTGCDVLVLNDADAAGIAEMTFGAGKPYSTKGVVLIITLGTGIGSALFVDGHLLPNTEFGHLQIREKIAERRASDAVRQKKALSWNEYADRLQEIFTYMEFLLSPDLLIVGGGVSKEHEKFLPQIKLRAKIVPAQLLNQAGIVGAALYASQMSQPPVPAP
jgi:polyphosphate glucokinase